MEIPYDEKTKLFTTDLMLNINQDFYLTEPNLAFYQYNLEKNSIVNSTRKSEEFEMKSKLINVPPNSIVNFYARLQLFIDKFDVILNFQMRNNATILTKIKNKANGNVKFMRYSFENLLKESESDDKYRKILEDENSFLRKNEKNLFEVTLKGRLEILRSWTLIWGEKDVK